MRNENTRHLSRRSLLQAVYGCAAINLLPILVRAAGTHERRFFHVMEHDGVWSLVTPEGKTFFSSGVCCVDETTLKQEAKQVEWTRATLARLRRWNFNTLGAWSSDRTCQSGMPYTVDLELGSSSTPSIPWGDPFSVETAHTMDAVARKLIVPRKDDPNLIGWFTDNEIGWWDETLFT